MHRRRKKTESKQNDGVQSTDESKQVDLKIICVSTVSPYSQELWLLSGGTGLTLHLQRVNVCDGDDSSCYVPGQTHKGTRSHQHTHPEQVQVVATTFLQSDPITGMKHFRKMFLGLM